MGFSVTPDQFDEFGHGDGVARGRAVYLQLGAKAY